MEQLLWSFDDLKRFTTHPDTPVRSWALERLIKLFPRQAGEVLLTMLDDPGQFIAGKALDFLAQTGETDRYGPILLEHLQRAGGDRFGRLASTLAKLEYRPALPVILAHLQSGGRQIDSNEVFWLSEALGRFGGDEARQMLWTLLEHTPASDIGITTLMRAILQAAQPDDIPRLVQYYRTLPPANHTFRTPLSEFAASVGVDRLVDELNRVAKNGLAAMLERAEWWLDAQSQLSQTYLADFEIAFNNKSSGVYRLLLGEAQRLVEEREDDVSAWQAAWEAGERPTGYRRRVLYTLLILQALADQPQTSSSRLQPESILGLGLLLHLSIDRDDQVQLEVAADKTEALLAILTARREHVLPDVIERVVALGPEIVPRLIDLLDPDDFSWAPIRVIHTLEQMARLHPGSCDAAVPKLIAAIHEAQGDFIKEAAVDALVAIGPPAVELINQHLRRTKDLSREIYLTGALADIPVKSAPQVILDKVESGKPIGEMEIMALSDIGSASAIEPLYRLWKPGDHLLAEQLLILCEINGVRKPELPEWRRLVAVEDERLTKVMSGELSEDFNPLEMLQKLASGEHPLMRTWQLEQKPPKTAPGRKKTISKKEQKKRLVQRKRSKGKKKKRRR